ncbi:MAG TPA: NAD(P)/FAD-dependent oxidoreductase [Pyrinomonadaceae bacterium]|jgi:flavin-dependent dehydrogenase
MYDAIIVGARVAGSPLAMLLARKGYRILLTDKSFFPSDTVSTHHVHQPGVLRLKRWGLLEEVRASNCPPLTEMSFDVGPFALIGTPSPAEDVTESFCPRRQVLDDILVRAASAAGAEVREGFTVREVTYDERGVNGIRGVTRAGTPVTERARIVIGADGKHSIVARSVAAPVYNERPKLTCNYYSYWSNVPLKGTELYVRERRMFVADRTNDGLTMVGLVLPMSEFDGVRSDVENRFMKELELVPSLAERLRAGRREEPIRGSGDMPNFFRRPYGTGWALAGDAGYNKDSITAQGITDSFKQAELMAEAIDAGFSGRESMNEALAEYERRRNEDAFPMYDFTCQLGKLEPPAPEMLQLFEALRENRHETNRFLGITAGTVPANEFFAPENLGRIIEGPRRSVAA